MLLTLENFEALSPLLITAFTSVVVMMAIAIRRNHRWNSTLAVVGLNLALLFIVYEVISFLAKQYLSEELVSHLPLTSGALLQGPHLLTPLFVVDGFSLFFSALILVAAVGSTALTKVYLEPYKRNREEMYLLIPIAATGAIVLTMAHHIASLFIGLEMMTVALYGMVAYTYDREKSLEASIKYVILSATASTIMLFGIALIYAQLGTLSFAEIGSKITESAGPLVIIGGMMMAAGLMFKLSLAPFHLWTPDVYEGSPAPVGAFLATAAKVSVFAVFVRFIILEASSVLTYDSFKIALLVVACLSMLLGNVLALLQNNIKRMLGYSSIAHFGYLFALLLLAPKNFSIEGFSAYMAIYVVTALTAFGVVTLMSTADSPRDADLLSDYSGLFWRRPVLASLMTVSMLSLAGIPLTAGFVAKMYVILGLIGVGMMGWVSLGFLALGSAIGIFFYLRTIVSMYVPAKDDNVFDAKPNWGYRTGGIIMTVTAFSILVIGLLPSPLMFISQMTRLVWMP